MRKTTVKRVAVWLDEDDTSWVVSLDTIEGGECVSSATCRDGIYVSRGEALARGEVEASARGLDLVVKG